MCQVEHILSIWGISEEFDIGATWNSTSSGATGISPIDL